MYVKSTGDIMKSDNFTTLSELYNRVQPALDCKVDEIKRGQIKYISKEDIWNFLKLNVWNYKNNLTLDEMVDDILNVSTDKLDRYVKREMKNYKREIVLEDDSSLL